MFVYKKHNEKRKNIFFNNNLKNNFDNNNNYIKFLTYIITSSKKIKY